MTLAGINTNTFKAHTYRGNLPSTMAKRNASPGQILAQGDWQQLGTFDKHYKRFSEYSIEGRLISRVIGAGK